MRNIESSPMTFEECLEFCTNRMCVMGYFPDEIEEAAKEMFECMHSPVKILLDKPRFMCYN